MTAYRFVTLTCDQCGEIYDSGTHVKVQETRHAAAREGWRYERRRDICPRCTQAIRSKVRWPINQQDPGGGQ